MINPPRLVAAGVIARDDQVGREQDQSLCLILGQRVRASQNESGQAGRGDGILSCQTAGGL